MAEELTLLSWTLREWPKAQYLARALGIPPEAWEIPFMFVPIGGPELSIFEAMEKPELGGLTARLKALTKPLAAAAYDDPWIRQNVMGKSKLAVAFHPGVDAGQVREMCTRDGYRVVSMATVFEARRDVELDVSLASEGVLDGHARWRRSWPAEAILERSLELPVWSRRHHSAAFYLVSRADDWSLLRELATDRRDAIEVVRALVTTDIGHPLLVKRLSALT